ncbi:MAG TPA: hypothetical protein VMW63_00270 [Methanoregulaceae archaeon]|nr:hypothetical protein [Methanoregulaceae archaeon]
MRKIVVLILGPLLFLAIVFFPLDPTVIPIEARYTAAVTLLLVIFFMSFVVSTIMGIAPGLPSWATL